VSVIYWVTIAVEHPTLYSWTPIFVASLVVMLGLWGRVWNVMVVFFCILLGIRLFGHLGGAQNYEIFSGKLGFIVMVGVLSCIIVGIRNLLIYMKRENTER